MSRVVCLIVLCIVFWSCTGDREQKKLGTTTAAFSSGGSKKLKVSNFCGVNQELTKKLRATMRSLYAKARRSQERNRRASSQIKKQWKQQHLSKRKSGNRWSPPRMSSRYMIFIKKRRSQFRKKETALKGLYKQQPKLLETKIRQQKRAMLFQDNEWLKHLKRK